MNEAVIESHDISSADRQGMTSILWENTAKFFDATSIAGSLNAHLDSFCHGYFSLKRSSKSKRISCKAGSQERYQPFPKPPQNPPPKKQQCKNQECLASDKKKLIACARVRCKRRVDSVAASPREYLVRRAAKNVISPPQKTTQNPPQETTMQESRVSCKLQEEVDSVCQGMVQEKSG